MNIIMGNRQTGRTTELLKLCAANNGNFVCRDQRSIKQNKLLAKSLGLEIKHFMTYHQFESDECISSHLYIDDFFDYFKHLTSKDIAGVSITKNDNNNVIMI